MTEFCKFVQPEYVKKFQCIADNCEDTCCSGWTIYVDKKTYNKCKALTVPTVVGIINDALVLNPNNTTDKKYSYIKFNKKGVCPLLTKEGFCTMHLNYGEEYLGEVCNLYPRNIKKLNNNYIQALSLSCVEAAKLCLLNPNGINFEIVDTKHQDKFDLFGSINTDNYENQEFINIQIHIISILQHKQSEIRYRIYKLGRFLQQLEKILVEKRYIDIEALLEKDEKLDINFNSQSQRGKIEFIFNIIDKRMKEGISNKIFYEFLKEFEKGFGLEAEMELDQLINSYNVGQKKLYEKFLNNHSYLWENYLVNTIFKELIPLNVGVKSTRAYFCLLLQYALLECFLVGIINYNENLTTEDIVKFIASFERVFPYNYLDKCYDDLSVELKDNFEFYKGLL